MKRVRDATWVAAGTLALALGIAGAILPLLPATPFFLLSAACYMRGSQRAHDWLVNHRVLGSSIRAFRSGRGLPRRARNGAIATLWVSMGTSAYVAAHEVVWVGLAVIGVIVTAYLMRLPVARQASSHEERDRRVVRGAPTEHEQVPDAVPVAIALVEDVEDDPRRIHGAARNDPRKTRPREGPCRR